MIAMVYDVNEGNFDRFIKKLRRKLRQILSERDGLYIFDGTFYGWCTIELRSNHAKVKVKINSRDFYFHGFQNSHGKWSRLNYPDNDNFGEASVFPYNGSYDGLLAKAGVSELHDIDLTRESMIHAIYVLSNFNGDLRNKEVPLAMLKLILMICESTRFYPIQASVRRFFKPIPLAGFAYNMPLPRFTYIQTAMLKDWYGITNAYFSEVVSHVYHDYGIFSRGDVKKKVAIGRVKSRGLNVDEGAGADGPNNGKGSGGRRDGHHKYEKGSASGSTSKGSASSSTSRSKEKSGGSIKGRKYSNAAYQGKAIDTIAHLQPLDLKLTKLQEIYEDCIHPLAWKRSLPTTNSPDSLIINNESGVQLHTVHTYQGHQPKILSHFRGAKEFLFRPEFNFPTPHQAIQFHVDWWRNTSPPSGVLRSILPVVLQGPAIGTITTSPYLSHLQQVHLLCASPVVRDLMKLPIAMSEVPFKSKKIRSPSRSRLLKWFNYPKGPAPELPLSSRGIMAGSLIGDLSTIPIDARSSFVPYRSWLARKR